MQLLSSYSAFLKNNLIDEMASEYFNQKDKARIPLVGYCETWTEELLKSKIRQAFLKCLDGISDNCFLESQHELIEDWCDSVMQDHMGLTDLNIIIDLQKQIFNSNIPKYTRDPDEVYDIFTGLESCFCSLKMQAGELFSKIENDKIAQSLNNENRYKQIVENSVDVVYTCDFNGYFTYINPAFNKLTGYNESDFLGKHYTEIVHPDWKERVKEFYSNQFKARTTKSVFTFMIANIRGESHWIEQTVTLLKDKSGLVKDFQGVVRDIEERMQYQEKLRDSENFLNVIIESIPLMVFVKDAREFKYVRCNRAGEKLTGYSTTDVFGKTDHDLFPKKLADFYHLKDKEVLETNKMVKIEQESVVVKNGDEIIIEIVKVPVKDDHGETKYILGIANDVTARRRMEEQRNTLLRDLERKNKELSEFAYIISHDLKSPLRAIGAISNWLAADYGDKINDKGKEQLKLLAGRVQRMDNLIDSIHKYSRLNQGREQKEQVDLNVLLAEEKEMMLSPSRNALNILIETPMPVIYCDKKNVLQLFENLLDNAVKHTNKNNGNIKIGCYDDGDKYRFYVSDDGPGIDKKYHEKIFRIFQALQSKEDNDGTGIGLAMVKKIVESKKGKVWVESKPGEGSTFFFTLPKEEVKLPGAN